MKSYIVRTHADQEFNGDYHQVGVIDTHYEENGAVLVLEVEVEDTQASSYERDLDGEPCVISYREA
jgi:hypothetical protein